MIFQGGPATGQVMNLSLADRIRQVPPSGCVRLVLDGQDLRGCFLATPLGGERKSHVGWRDDGLERVFHPV